MKRIHYQELLKQSEMLVNHVRMVRILHATSAPCRKAAVGALMATTMPELGKVHPAYAAYGAIKEQRRKLTSIKFYYSSGYDKETDTFATPDTASGIRLMLQDQVVNCLRCKSTGEYEGEYGATSCMGCLVEGPDYSDGMGNLMVLREGQTLTWFSDMTFEVTGEPVQ